ncbi:MAG: nitroreductase family protein [Bacteroidaceae bacterium]
METFLDLVKQRRSIRTFTEEPLTEEQVVELMKAALMSPSSKSTRGWDFVLVDNKDYLHQLSECKPVGAGLLEGASLAVVVVMDPEKSDVWIEDGSVASTILLLQAEALGLGGCWVQIHNRCQEDQTPAEDFVKQILGIPENLKVLSIIGIGHKAMERKPQNEDKLTWEKVHLNNFGNQ